VSDNTKKFALFLTFVCAMAVWNCGGAEAKELMAPRKLVDAHTAGVLRRGMYDFECRIYPAGDSLSGAGLTLGIDVGITDRLTIGLSYGGEGIVGRGRDARFHNLPGWLVKYRLFEEKLHFPGIAFGYDHQGHGGIADSAFFSYRGYVYKSPGFFVSFSKNYLFFNSVQFGMHGMCNYSMEDYRNVHWPDFTAGMDVGVNDELFVVFEYNFGFNTRDPLPGTTVHYAVPSEGYFNAGIRWAFSPEFYIEFDARDLFEHRRFNNGRILGWNREIKLVFFSGF